MTVNPIKAWRDYRWRRRVEWFSQQATSARHWRDSPFNLKRNPPELIRQSFEFSVLIAPYPGPDSEEA